MLIVNSRKPSIQIKKKFRASFSPEDYLPFPFQGTFFPQNMFPANVSIFKVIFDLFLYWKVPDESLRTFSTVLKGCRNVSVRFFD